jgi:CubicO group peptidase (beta-lactamase class C family)
MTPLPDPLRRTLERRVRTVQREDRIPGIAVGVVRDGELLWSLGAGAADVGEPDVAPSADTAFAVGSISKTFTAALVMILRDEGRLALTDRLVEHLPGHRHTAITLRELLAHASGLQREPPGNPWDTMQMPSIEELIAGLVVIEQVLPARLRWHYSNLAFALLGEVVVRIEGRPLDEVLQARLLGPLGMRRTGWTPAAPRAVGYYTHPFTDQVQPERWPEMGAFAAAGGLWSTVEDLARWAKVLSDGAEDVLKAATVEEMTRPEIMSDLESWTLAAGLGLQLFRAGERVMVGHSGGMPGFVSGLAVRRSDRTAVIALTNTSAGTDPMGLAIELLTTVLDQDPPSAPPWRPGPPVPPELAPLIGRWWTEGSGLTFSVRAGRLEARLDGAPAERPPAVFAPDGEDRFRGESGREEGELLVVERSADGSVTRMLWAGYPLTREPAAFGDG